MELRLTIPLGQDLAQRGMGKAAPASRDLPQPLLWPAGHHAQRRQYQPERRLDHLPGLVSRGQGDPGRSYRRCRVAEKGRIGEASRRGERVDPTKPEGRQGMEPASPGLPSRPGMGEGRRRLYRSHAHRSSICRSLQYCEVFHVCILAIPTRRLPITRRLSASIRSLYTPTYNRGVTRFGKGDFNGAAADFADAMRLDPNSVDAYYAGAARCIRRRVNLDRTIADYTEAIRIRPTYRPAYLGRADAYEGKGDFRARQPGSGRRACSWRPSTIRRQGNLDSAELFLKGAIDFNPKHATAYPPARADPSQEGECRRRDRRLRHSRTARSTVCSGPVGDKVSNAAAVKCRNREKSEEHSVSFRRARPSCPTGAEPCPTPRASSSRSNS